MTDTAAGEAGAEVYLSGPVRLALQAVGISAHAQAGQQLAAYADLLRRWNAFSGLMSRGELEHLGAHMLDALSLAPYLRDATSWLDIGSGGGFPAIPVAVVLPGVRVLLLERNVKKVGFLRKVVGALGLGSVEVVHGNFPEVVRDRRFSHLTGRAVEKPGVILRAAAPFLREGAEFLWQSGQLSGDLGKMFHVEPVDDLWKTSGWRRGTLHRITLPADT
jgi:16S rRNA (guanine(527)-N(7))-methyltransferase RsmG